MQITSYINGALYSGPDTFVKKNAFTNEDLHQVSSCDLMGFLSALQSSHKAYVDFKNSEKAERIALVNKIISQLEINQQNYAQREALDQALPYSASLQFNLGLCIAEAKSQLESYKHESAQLNGAVEKQNQSVGLISLVATWNLSLRQILRVLIPALLAGNSIVIKVSSESPVTATILAEILMSVACPVGLVNVIVTKDQDVKKLFWTHPAFKAISVMGRLETAQAALQSITQNSLQSFKKIQILSGSKNSAVVLTEPDEDIFNSVLETFMLGQGQLAWGSARLFILEKFESHWQERLQNYLSNLKPSEGIEDSSLWTPIIRETSIHQYTEIQNQARQDQAKLMAAPTLDQIKFKNYLSPIFTKDMSRCSTLQQDQVHSPFFILSTVKYPFDVPKYSNVSYFGFAAHLFGDKEKLQKISQELEVGLITYNKGSIASIEKSVALKQSGFGLQDLSPFGDFFSNSKTLLF